MTRTMRVWVSSMLVAAGYTAALGGGRKFALARYLSDGTLDSTFGGDGRVIMNDMAGRG